MKQETRTEPVCGPKIPAVNVQTISIGMPPVSLVIQKIAILFGIPFL